MNAALTDRRFPSTRRLRRKRDFDRVFREGMRLNGREVQLIFRPRSEPPSRLGLVVGRRHGNAVRRNRIRRLLREAFRHVIGEASIPFDIVALPRRGRKQTFEGLCETFRLLLGRAEKRVEDE